MEDAPFGYIGGWAAIGEGAALPCTAKGHWTFGMDIELCSVCIRHFFHGASEAIWSISVSKTVPPTGFKTVETQPGIWMVFSPDHRLCVDTELLLSLYITENLKVRGRNFRIQRAIWANFSRTTNLFDH